MGDLRSSSIKYLLCIHIIFLALQIAESGTPFQCKFNPEDPGTPLPSIPKDFSNKLRVNYESAMKSVEIRQVVKSSESRSSYEIWERERHVRYIHRGDENTLLVINYKPDENPVCTVKKRSKSSTDNMFEGGDSGPSDILYKITIAVAKHERFYDLGPSIVDGILVQQWEGCFDEPDIKIRLTFAVSEWKSSHSKYSLEKGTHGELTQVEAVLDGKVVMTADAFSYDPTPPGDEEFQPPEGVHCEGFRTDKKPPKLPAYFTYQSEIVTYESLEGIAPVVSHRTVYYDYPSGITRVDFQDALTENRDMFSPVTAQLKSIIHDFNSGVQYSLDPTTGLCTVDEFKATFSAISAKETVDNVMLDTRQFFILDSTSLSYNGQYSTRGLMADVFSGTVTENEEKRIFHWYFSTERTQLVENEHVEKNVLLRMLSRPEAAEGKEGQVEINFYNFVQEEPSAFTYDLRSCYNGSQSKTMVLTFPANNQLNGEITLVKGVIQEALTKAAQVSKQRIFVEEVEFKEKYIYAEFRLMGPPPLKKTTTLQPSQISIDEATTNLKNAVEGGTFSVSVTMKGKVVVLKPEPNGLNEFAGDRSANQPVIGYTEGSVVGLTVGMLLLGTLLGAVFVNLIISKRFGVSLFRNSNFDNQRDTLNESSM